MTRNDLDPLILDLLEWIGREPRSYADVIDACDSDIALRVLESDEPIDLLLTDIVMPGRHDGFGLGKQARRLRQGLKVLHVTGYPEQINANPMMVRSGALMQRRGAAPRA